MFGILTFDLALIFEILTGGTLVKFFSVENFFFDFWSFLCPLMLIMISKHFFKHRYDFKLPKIQKSQIFSKNVRNFAQIVQMLPKGA